MSEGVENCALEHALDRLWPCRLMFVFNNRTVLTRSCSHRFLEHRDGIIYEELDPYGRKTHRRWAPRAVIRRLVSEEKLSSIDLKSRDVPVAQVPQNLCAERCLVKGDCRIAVS